MIDKFPMKIKILLTYSLNKIQKLDYLKCINALEDARTMISNKCENCLLEQIERLLLLVEEYLMNDAENDFTLQIN